MRTMVVALSALAWAGCLAAQSPRLPNTRNGFWMGFGVGGGSAGTTCSTCTGGHQTGISGYFRMGGAPSRSLLVGGEATFFARSTGGVDQRVTFASMIVMWYPERAGALYLKLGVGALGYRSDDGTNVLTATAPSLALGLGYEVRVAPNLSVVPFMNALGSSAVRIAVNGSPANPAEDVKVNLVQAGVGLTWH